ncbi:MAG: hypothetical protein BWY08_00753 [Bacteroidetes bacterium ADurb.Bin174]|nr:MAG: hypothetical protein BWY08_00753 [Bacteroidetes bacterium ADurb.Bin174]
MRFRIFEKNMNIRISKTKYLNGLQCKKLLWHIYNAPESIPEPDEDTQAVFEQGHLVGEYAKKLFPAGIESFGMATKEKEREEKGLTDYGIIYLSGVIGEKVKHRYSLGKDDL